MDIKAYMQDLGIAARKSSRVLARAGTAIKNNALLAIATRLDDGRHNLLAANTIDMENGRNNGLDAALLDRLELNDERISGMIEGLKQVAALQDPIGTITDMGFRPSGIQLGKMRVLRARNTCAGRQMEINLCRDKVRRIAAPYPMERKSTYLATRL